MKATLLWETLFIRNGVPQSAERNAQGKKKMTANASTVKEGTNVVNWIHRSEFEMGPLVTFGLMILL